MRPTFSLLCCALVVSSLAACRGSGAAPAAVPAARAARPMPPAAPSPAGTCAVPRSAVNLPAKYDAPRASAPGFPQVNTPFEQMTARARSTGKPAILYFCADWCGYCRKMNRETLSDPAVQRRIAEFPATMYDAESRLGRDVANRFGIDAYPTMVLVDGSGRQIDQILGARPPASFLDHLARY